MGFHQYYRVLSCTPGVHTNYIIPLLKRGYNVEQCLDKKQPRGNKNSYITLLLVVIGPKQLYLFPLRFKYSPVSSNH